MHTNKHNPYMLLHIIQMSIKMYKDIDSIKSQFHKLTIVYNILLQ